MDLTALGTVSLVNDDVRKLASESSQVVMSKAAPKREEQLDVSDDVLALARSQFILGLNLHRDRHRTFQDSAAKNANVKDANQFGQTYPFADPGRGDRRPGSA